MNCKRTRRAMTMNDISPRCNIGEEIKAMGLKI